MTRSATPRSALHRIATASLAVAIALTVTTHESAAKKHRDGPASISFHWAGVPPGERVIEVYGVSGNIRATHSESETLFVDATVRGTKTDPADVKVGAELTANGARVCARYPRPSGDLNPCGESQDTHADDVIVDFTVRVPPGAKLIASTVNGSVGGEDMQGPVEAHTVNGGISIVSTHRVTASAVNGSIDVMMGPLGWSEPMAYTTTNGSVLLRIPPFANAVLDATTHTGHVTCRLPLTSSERSESQRLVGTVGTGGPRLRLETLKGDVEILAQ